MRRPTSLQPGPKQVIPAHSVRLMRNAARDAGLNPDDKSSAVFFALCYWLGHCDGEKETYHDHYPTQP